MPAEPFSSGRPLCSGRYGFFLFALFVIASGLSFLETASNPFIAQLGSPESAARRLNFSQAFNPLGAISGVLIGTVFIFSGIELTPSQVAAMQAANTYEAYLRHETMRVVVPYLVVGLVALIWAVLIARTKFPTIAREHENAQEEHGSFKELLRLPEFSLCHRRPISVRGRPGRHLELLHSVRAGRNA